jgi:hypothetical protein
LERFLHCNEPEFVTKRLQIVDQLDKLSQPITQRRVQQILATSPNLVFKKPCKKPALLQRHKVARMEFARKTKEWNNVVFSDEKKFNLDGFSI